VVQLYPQVLGSLFVASYDPQGNGGAIPTRLHTGYESMTPSDETMDLPYNHFELIE
jgi:hypothetical protein